MLAARETISSIAEKSASTRPGLREGAGLGCRELVFDILQPFDGFLCVGEVLIALQIRS